jgi:hypothetical protein
LSKQATSKSKAIRLGADVKNRNLQRVLVLGVFALALSACGSSATLTPPVTRVVTQTPWIIYVPITTTPEPATITPLPTADTGPKATPSRTATRFVAVKPLPTKAAAATAAPVTAAPKATAPPACSYGTVQLREPKSGDPRFTKADGSGGSAFIMQWDPPESLAGSADPQIGYRIDMVSRRGNQVVNGATAWVSHNKYISDTKFTFDQRAVSQLAAGDTATVTWTVTIIKTSGVFNDGDYSAAPPGEVKCGPASSPFQINLIING